MKATEGTASELVGRMKDSDAVVKAQAKGAELAERARTRMRDTQLDERAAELAERARTRVRDAHLDERAAELAERARTVIRESEAAQRAAERARLAGDQALERVGTWLAESGTAEKMGMEPAARRRRLPAWLAAVAGAGVGFVVAKLVRREEAVEPIDDFAASAEHLATTPPPAEGPTGAQATEAAGGNGGLDLEDRIRSRLEADPRTAELSGLAINVAESTVFVRGNVPRGTDEAMIREVVGGVPGVTDVDLQVTTSA